MTNWPRNMPLTDPIHDTRLLTEMRHGNARAFEDLYRRHQGPLYRFALLRSGSADTAADIVQEIFLALLSDKLKFDPGRGALQSFLFGVARNYILKREESQRRFVSTTANDEGDEVDDILADTASEPMAQLLANQQAERVRQALARLAPHYRDVVILYEMHDLTYVEIAQTCNIDIGTVRSRLSRARAQLLQLLQHDPTDAVPNAIGTSPASRQEARL